MRKIYRQLYCLKGIVQENQNCLEDYFTEDLERKLEIFIINNSHDFNVLSKIGGENIKKLIDYIENAKYYEKEFVEWEAFEQIIDENKAFWMLKKPGSQYQKVCLYRDGYNMFVYGDYGQFTFDSMTWTGNVYNLEYDNIGYQMEKLSHESKQSLKVFNEFKCEEDIIDWLKYQLEEHYNLESDEIKKAVSFIETNPFVTEIKDFCNNENPFFDIEDILISQKSVLKIQKNMSGYHF